MMGQVTCLENTKDVQHYNSEGSVSHINGVWPVLSVKQLFAVRSILRIKTKPTIEPPTSAFFLAETRVHSNF